MQASSQGLQLKVTGDLLVLISQAHERFRSGRSAGVSGDQQQLLLAVSLPSSKNVETRGSA